ncbi:MAG: AAA family ATPase [Ruminococcaceae bacterium]|nr:AAA family ATPase [Oscillospiraceae bacterium]
MAFYLIGEKLGHSWSKPIHEKLGHAYDLKEIAREDLGGFLQKGDFRGLNVTIPYKQAVMPYCAELSETARRIGSVNTIVKREDGSLYGDNTDIDGFLYMCDRAQIDFAGKKVLILGSGGTSLTAREAVRVRGARETLVVSRRGEVNYETVYTQSDAQIVVNTTPVGMYPNIGIAPLDLRRFPSLEAVADVIYNPLRSQLLLDAASLGVKTAGGLPMLVAQAARASELFLGEPIAREAVERVTADLAASMRNIVLIGMPGSGKTTVGKGIAQALNMPFYDADAEIERKAGKSIPQIFAEAGEVGFRDLESQVCSELSALRGCVISTGGGCVLREENRNALRSSGLVIRVARDIGSLSTDGRPLSKSREALCEMARVREPFYSACADMTFDNNGPAEDTVQAILKEIETL